MYLTQSEVLLYSSYSNDINASNHHCFEADAIPCFLIPLRGKKVWTVDPAVKDRAVQIGRLHFDGETPVIVAED